MRFFRQTASFVCSPFLRNMSTPSVTGCIACWTTCPSEEVAEKVASKIVADHVGACVNIIPGVSSVYWWDGKVNKDQEFLLMIKSTQERKEALIQTIKDNHPYDVPEIITADITGGSEDYLSWVRNSVNPNIGNEKKV